MLLRSLSMALATFALILVGFAGGALGADLPSILAQIRSENPNDRMQAVEALIESGAKTEDVARALLEAHMDFRNAQNVSKQAREAFVAFGEGAVPPLLDLFQRGDRGRQWATNLLTQVAHKHTPQTIRAALPTLVAALANPEAIHDCLRPLETLGPDASAAVPALTEALKREQRNYDRYWIMNCLIAIAGEEYEPAKEALRQYELDQKLIEAAFESDLDGIRSTLDAGANIDADYVDLHAFLSSGRTGYTALMAAIFTGSKEVVRFLLEQKPDLAIQRKNRDALYISVQCELPGITDLLVKAGARGNPDQIRRTLALLTSACRGFSMGSGGRYPLYPGCFRGSDHTVPIAELLVEGENVNVTDPDGFTPLMYAAGLGLTDNVRVLLEHGADPTMQAQHGETALFLALQSRRDAVVELLDPDGTLTPAPKLSVVKRNPAKFLPCYEVILRQGLLHQVVEIRDRSDHTLFKIPDSGNYTLREQCVDDCGRVIYTHVIKVTTQPAENDEIDPGSGLQAISTGSRNSSGTGTDPAWKRNENPNGVYTVLNEDGTVAFQKVFGGRGFSVTEDGTVVRQTPKKADDH